MPTPALQILVCTNDRGVDSDRASCCQRGSTELYRALKDAVKARGLRDQVLVTRTGCLRHCSRGPTVVFWPGNLWHGCVAVEDVTELLEAALAGRQLERRTMPPGPWE